MSEGSIWLIVLIPTAVIGIVCGYFIKRCIGAILAGALPWLGVLGVLLYEEYIAPYKGGGASMWPIAQLFVGTIAAGVGIGFYYLSKNLIKKIKNS